MSERERKFLQETISTLKQQRDELALKIHLGGAELKDEWDVLDGKLSKLTHEFEPLKHAVAESGEGLWESMKLVGEEIKSGFDRIRKSL